MATMTINREQRLYVEELDKGYTCLGFDVAFERLSRLHAEMSPMLAKPLPQMPKYRGTKKVYNMLKDLQNKAMKIHAEHNIQFKSELTPQLVGLEGKRVEVVDCHGEKRRFIVGKSVGWIPSHLEVKKSNSMGGFPTYGTPYKSVTVI